MRLISSGVALHLVLALTQHRNGARLAELATAANVSLSTAQTAMSVLLADGIVARAREHRPRYRVRAKHPANDAIVRLAGRYAPPREALDIVLRANPSVEFAARDRDGYVAVEHPLADPRDLVALDHVVALIGAGRKGPSITRYAHHELVDRLRDDAAPRRRAEAATLLKGSLALSFPARVTRQRRVAGERPQRLGHVSRRALAAIARSHHLRRIRLFGSGARATLGSSSDLDVLVEPHSDARLSLLDLARLEAELEAVLGRHVNIATPGNLG